MNILAIKGGGARGVIVTRFLVEIEKITKIPAYKLFDYIGGSSVGALIACGILVTEDGENTKYTAQQVHDIFMKDMLNAFSWTYGSWISSGFGLLGPSYTNAGLLKITEELCGDKKLGCLLKPIIFPAYDRIRHKAYYFDKDKDKDVTLHNVIMSCTAAPTYFPSHLMHVDDNKYDMIDGGVVANNTAELVFLQATKNMQCIDKSKILELNIGTGIFTNSATERHGMLTWVPMIVDTLMHAYNENELFELSLTLPQENYYILDVPLDLKYYYIDDVRKATIEYYINETEKWIEVNKHSIKAFCYKLLQNKGFDLPTEDIIDDMVEDINKLDDICKKAEELIEDNDINNNVAQMLTNEMIEEAIAGDNTKDEKDEEEDEEDDNGEDEVDKII